MREFGSFLIIQGLIVGVGAFILYPLYVSYIGPIVTVVIGTVLYFTGKKIEVKTEIKEVY